MTEPETETPIGVGIALVARDGRYLVRQRPPGGPMPGVWEFPGGKCEPGESAEKATQRECAEETGIDVNVGRLRRRTDYRYPHGWVELSYFDCTTVDERAEPDPSTGFRWVDAAALLSLRFPDANGPILDELANAAYPHSGASDPPGP